MGKKATTKRPLRVETRHNPGTALGMLIDGQERIVEKAYGVETAIFQRALSGDKGILLMLDLAQMQGTQDWYGYILPPEEARKLAASLNGLADEIEAMTTTTPPSND